MIHIGYLVVSNSFSICFEANWNTNHIEKSMEGMNLNFILLSNNKDIIKIFSSILSRHDLTLLIARNTTEISLHNQNKSILGILIDLSCINTNNLEDSLHQIQTQEIPLIYFNSNQGNIRKIHALYKATIHLSDPLVELFYYINKGNKGNSEENQSTERIRLSPKVIFDIASHCIIKNGDTFYLSTTEFRILYLLAKNTGKVFSVQEIIESINLTNPQNLYVHMINIRKKIELKFNEPRILLNERGKGYKLICN